MLSTLPMHVKMPTTKLLLEMNYLLDLRVSSIDVRKAGILCYATLIHKTYVNQSSNDGLTEYVDDLWQRLESWYLLLNSISLNRVCLCYAFVTLICR